MSSELNGFTFQDIINARSAWTTVYPVMLRRKLQNSEIRYEESLLYIASTQELAEAWCKRNTDIEMRNDKDRWWWFCIMQEAIDGEFSGIRGQVALLDWDGNSINYDPVNGYRKPKDEVKQETK